MINELFEKYDELGIKYITQLYTNDIAICSFPNNRFMVYKDFEADALFKTNVDEAKQFVIDRYHATLIWEKKDDEVILSNDNFKYTVKFMFSDRITNITNAQKYLNDDDYLVYIKQSLLDNTLKAKIKSINWNIKSVFYGYIEVNTNSELNEIEIEKLTNWCSNFQVNELNDGFEQQDFANYNVNKFLFSRIKNYIFKKDNNVIVSFLPLKTKFMNIPSVKNI